MQLLIDYNADPIVEEAEVADGALDNQSPRILLRRTPLEAAARMPRILHVLDNSIAHQ